MREHVTISRDSFARCEFIRETVPAYDRRPCRECGGSPGRFRYGFEPDAIYPRVNWLNGAFCGVECCRAYHGLSRDRY